MWYTSSLSDVDLGYRPRRPRFVVRPRFFGILSEGASRLCVLTNASDDAEMTGDVTRDLTGRFHLFASWRRIGRSLLK